MACFRKRRYWILRRIPKGNRSGDGTVGTTIRANSELVWNRLDYPLSESRRWPQIPQEDVSLTDCGPIRLRRRLPDLIFVWNLYERGWAPRYSALCL